jgi:hypothetical protein
MDGAGGKYFKLNATGAVVWDALTAGKSYPEILDELRIHLPLAESRLRSDLDNLLDQLRQRHLIVPDDGLAPSPATPPAERSPAEEPPEVETAAQASRPRFLSVLRAYAALVAADFVLRSCGYRRFYRLIRGWPVSRRRGRLVSAAAVCSQVDAAARFYFKRAWCLQRSAATVCLLRRGGRPAQLVVGVHELPFGAHAWVELEGRVINDDPRVRRYYQEIERL